MLSNLTLPTVAVQVTYLFTNTLLKASASHHETNMTRAGQCYMTLTKMALEMTLKQTIAVQVTYLFTNTLLKGIEPSDSSDGKTPPVDVDFRIVVLRCLRPVCTDGQLLIDLFVNYDCDAQGQTVDLFDRLFKGLIKCAITPEALQDGAAGDMTAVQRNRLRQEALSCVVAMLESLNTWCVTFFATFYAPQTHPL